MLLLRSIFFTVLMPGTVTVWIPLWLVSAQGAQSVGLWRYAGLPLIVVGAALLLWCIGLFYTQGRGTLAPVDPPKHLVVQGLYCYVRNPMYVSVMLILIGETIFFASPYILLETGIFLTITHLFIKYYEEPALRRQFGEPYVEYTQTVGRWVPKPLPRGGGNL